MWQQTKKEGFLILCHLQMKCIHDSYTNVFVITLLTLIALSPQCQPLSVILKDSSVSSQLKFWLLASKGMAIRYMIFIFELILLAINFHCTALWSPGSNIVY